MRKGPEHCPGAPGVQALIPFDHTISFSGPNSEVLHCIFARTIPGESSIGCDPYQTPNLARLLGNLFSEADPILRQKKLTAIKVIGQSMQSGLAHNVPLCKFSPNELSTS